MSWYKMERPNVIMDNGHITHFTFAVTDVDKGQISGGSNHGNKVVVMAFDGVAFDNDYGVGGVDAGAAGAAETQGPRTETAAAAEKTQALPERAAVPERAEVLARPEATAAERARQARAERPARPEARQEA